jgi:hypothetical protein
MVHLYLIGNADYRWYKIGLSADPARRCVALDETKLPFQISVIRTHKIKDQYALHVERRVHRFYSAQRLRGEWFRDIDPDDFCMQAQRLSKDIRAHVLRQHAARRYASSLSHDKRKRECISARHDGLVLAALKQGGLDAARAVRTNPPTWQQIHSSNAVL